MVCGGLTDSIPFADRCSAFLGMKSKFWLFESSTAELALFSTLLRGSKDQQTEIERQVRRILQKTDTLARGLSPKLIVTQLLGRFP